MVRSFGDFNALARGEGRYQRIAIMRHLVKGGHNKDQGARQSS
jgi:hypothetical protein